MRCVGVRALMMPHITTIEKHVEVPQIQTVEKIVEVPQVEHHQGTHTHTTHQQPTIRHRAPPQIVQVSEMGADLPAEHGGTTVHAAPPPTTVVQAAPPTTAVVPATTYA